MVVAWLVPPVRMVLMRAHVERAQAAFFESLSAAEYATLVGYVNKAAGWQLVGLGGFLVALQQTHQLAHEHATGEWLFVGLVVAGVVLSFGLVTMLRRRG